MRSTPAEIKSVSVNLFADPDALVFQPLYIEYKKAVAHHPDQTKIFDKLFESIITQKNIGEYYKKQLIPYAAKLASQFMLQNLEDNSEFKLFNEYLVSDITYKTWESLEPKLDSVITTAHYQKYLYKENPAEIEAAIARFNREVEFTLPADELKEIEGLYKKAAGYRQTCILATNEELDNLIQSAATTLKSNPDYKLYRAVIVAAFREKIHRLYGIYPNATQIINFFALINNPRRIAQIKTGEGKSLIIAMLSAYSALLGRKVDVITTSPDLAEPQAKHYTPFYQSVGLSVSCNAGSENNCNPDVYKADIVYGTVEDFESAKIQDGLGGNIIDVKTEDDKKETVFKTDGKSARGNRPYDMAIVDEVDSMFLDTGNTCLWIPLEEENPEIVPLYQAIWNYVASHDEADLTELMFYINEQKIGIELREDDSRMDTMLHPLMLAACRAKSSEDKKDYLFDKDKQSIEIINLPTGEVKFGMRWNQGMHAFVELKHGIKPKCTVDINATSISPPDLFAHYESLIGLSGTLGSLSDRKELSKVYGVDLYASPTFSDKSNVFEVAPLIVADEREQFAIALQRILEEKGKPAHIVLDSIGAVERFRQFLTEKLSSRPEYKIHTYDRQKGSADLDKILIAAGQPFSINLTTNIGGRGTDIPLSDEAIKLGGLFEMTLYPPENERIELQASGRTGRKGQPGITQVIAHRGQFKQYPDISMDEKDSYADFRKRRETYNETKSLQRQKDRLLLSLQYAVNEFYYSLPQAVKSEFLKKWAVECYNPIISYIDNIKSFLESNPEFYATVDKINFEGMVAKLLLDKIETFWQTNSSVISRMMAEEKSHTATAADWINHQKNKFTRHLLTSAQTMKDIPVATPLQETKKSVEVVLDLDLTLIPAFTGGTFDVFPSDKAKPQDAIVHFDEMKKFIASGGAAINYTVASFGINTARSERAMQELKIEKGRTLGFHPEMLDVVLDDAKITERCSQHQQQWGANCMNRMNQILETAGFGKPPDMNLLRMCQLTILTSCGEIGKNMHLLLSILLRLQSGTKLTDVVFVDDDRKNIDAAKQFHLALPQLALLLKNPELTRMQIHAVQADVKEISRNKFTVNWFDKFNTTMQQVLSVEKSAEKLQASDASVTALLSRSARGTGVIKPKSAEKDPHQTSGKNFKRD